VLAGLVLLAAFAGMVLLGDLRQHTARFLALFGLAGLAYALAAARVLRASEGSCPLWLILVGAVLFRGTLLASTPPTLSDDVYRYIWDGRMAAVGINPYAHAVNSPFLDSFASPQRDLVNHPEMASPYLPAAQGYLALVYRVAPDSPLAFQSAAALCDLAAGLLVLDLLRRLGLPRTWVLLYLWHPLVVVEFAHGAHVDALMLLLVTAALWLLVVSRRRVLSAALLAAATLTKGLPALLLPIFARRWRWPHSLLYALLVAGSCIPFALGAGWGLGDTASGEGLFGALRIYGAQWNYNGSLYRALEWGLGSLRGLLPFGLAPQAAARVLAAALLGAVLIVVWRMNRQGADDQTLLQQTAVVWAAYLALTTTVHPWYVTLLVPLLPFLAGRNSRFLLPALYFSLAVALSYSTYLDPARPGEQALFTLVEYLPAYALLLWAAWPASGGSSAPGSAPGRPGT
jgi:hypothetical protein